MTVPNSTITTTPQTQRRDVLQPGRGLQTGTRSLGRLPASQETHLPTVITPSQNTPQISTRTIAAQHNRNFGKHSRFLNHNHNPNPPLSPTAQPSPPSSPTPAKDTSNVNPKSQTRNTSQYRSNFSISPKTTEPSGTRFQLRRNANGLRRLS